MAVTRSTAADRRRTTGISPIPGLHPAMARDRETLLLGGGIIVFLVGLLLVYLAMTRPFAEVEPRLRSGEIVAIEDLREPEQLTPLLGFLGEPAERTFVARQIFQRVQEGPLQNIGELARLRVPVAEVDGNGRLPMLQRRVEGLRQTHGGNLREGAEVVLLSSGQLTAIKPRLIVRKPAAYKKQLALWGTLFLVSFLAAHAVFRVRRFAGDQLLLPIALVLSGLGLLIMVSIRDPLRDMLLFRTFVQGVLGGMVLLCAASLIDVQRSPLRRLTFAPLGVAILLSGLLIVFGSGPGGSDAKVNLFGFQPVEVVKILVVLFLAGYLHDRWEFLRDLSEKRAGLGGVPSWLRVPRLDYVIPPLAALAVVLVFFFFQRDLGPALILSFLFLLVYSVARGRAVMLAVGTILMVIAFWTGYQLQYPQTVTARLGMWMSPWDNAFRGGDHLAQSLWALSAGSFTGTGLGLGQPGLVPEIHTDMVLAAIGEELGFAGLLVVLGLYTLLVWRGLRAARRADGVYGFFLGLGLSLLLALQVLLISGGVLGVLPLSGVVSPFLSSGRSAMLANFLIVGLLLAISARPGRPEAMESVRRFDGAVRWATLALGAFGLAILAKAALVQVFRADHYLAQSALVLHADNKRYFDANPRLEQIAKTIPRGSILDRNGIPLATSDPKELERQRATFERLGVSLERTVTADKRIYPFGGRTFHLLGDRNNQVNWGASNTSYAERDSRIRLQGYDDYAEVVEVTQPNGDVTREIRVDYSELIPLLRHQHQPEHKAVKRIQDRNRNLRMAIDARLQLRAADILATQARQAGHGGAAVVLDAETGDLLASVSYPWPRQLPIEPSSGAEDDEKAGEALFDRARYGIYPPGSTFKLVTALAALRKNPAVANQTYACEALSGGRVGHRVRGFGKPIRDDPTAHTPHGQVDLEKGIRVSCNAYFAQLGTLEVGPNALLETAQLLGITVAQPNTPEQLKMAIPQASYGQGQVTATPFEMARVGATVANDGLMPEGRWVIDESNERKRPPVEVLTGPPIALLQRSMREVVTGGSAAFLAEAQPPIAGKTGTAEVQGKKSHSWFVAFAPFGAPEGSRRVAVAVLVEHGGYGGRFAAPAAAQILQTASELGLMRAAPAAVNPRAPAAP